MKFKLLLKNPQLLSILHNVLMNETTKNKTFNIIDNEEYTYEIVGAVQADPLNGKISNESALGTALLGKPVSDKEIDVLSEVPYKIIIKSFTDVE